MIDPVAAVLVIIYFIAMVGIGIWASKKIQNMSDYVVAGRSLDFWVFTMLMIGSVCSGMSLLGVSGLGYKFAWPTIWEQLAVPLSIAFCIIFFGVKMHTVAKKSGYMTVQDYLAHRFESQTSLRGMSATAGIVVSMIYLAGQYTAISIVLMWLFGLPHWLALLIGAAIVTIYTVIGGLYAVAWTTLIQGLILILGVLIMAPIVILAAGGFTHINEVMAAVNPTNVDPWVTGASAVFTPEYIVSFALLLTIGLACAPHVINNILCVRDVKVFKWAPLVAFGIYAVVMVLAAVMSTTDRLMLTIGTYFSWDIYKKILRPDAPDKQVLLISQISVFIAAAVTLLLALNPPDMLVWLIWAGIGIMFATFAVPLLAGLYWRRATREGALASMALGLIVSLVFGGISYFKLAKLPMHFSFYAFVIAVIAMIVVSFMTKPTSEKVLDETMTGWYIRK